MLLRLAPKTLLNENSETPTANRLANDESSSTPVFLSDYVARGEGDSDEEICHLHASGLRQECGSGI